MRLPSRPVLRVLCCGLLLGGCAPKQRLSLECVPHEVSVYVDGRHLEDLPDSIKLRRDEHHTLFFKGGGYQPHMVLLRTEDVDGKIRLNPPDICSQALFVEMSPELTIEATPEVSGGPPAAP